MTWYYPDISEWQPNARVRDILDQSGGIICIRAGHGDHHDFKFDGWRDQLTDARLVMIYLYLDTADGDGRRNADLFINHVGRERRPNEVFVADIEPGGGNWTVGETREFHNRVRDVLGGPKLMTYANESYAKGRLPLFTDTHGWVARWGQPGRDTRRPSVPHISWQHAADGYGKPRVHWAGCSREADENRVEVSRDEFVATLLPDSKPKPTPPKPKPQPKEDEGMYVWGNVYAGQGQTTVIPIYPGQKLTGLGFGGHPALQGVDEVVLRVDVHDAEGWYTKTVVITSDEPKPWFLFRDNTTTDLATVTRVGYDDSVYVPVGWDAHWD